MYPNLQQHRRCDVRVRFNIHNGGQIAPDEARSKRVGPPRVRGIPRQMADGQGDEEIRHARHPLQIHVLLLHGVVLILVAEGEVVVFV